MPRGFPDDNIQSNPLGQTVADNAELAARLGSPYTVYRSGNVLYATDFSNGVEDWVREPISDTYVGVRGINTWKGSSCIGMLADFFILPTAVLRKNIPTFLSSSFGLECTLNWECQAILNDAILYIGIYQTIGAFVYGAVIKIDPGAHAIYLLTDVPLPGTYVPIISGLEEWRATFDRNAYQWFKLVIDWDTLSYKRIYWNNNAVNISSYTLGSIAAFSEVYRKVQFFMPGKDNTYYLDIGCVILTMNEP